MKFIYALCVVIPALFAPALAQDNLENIACDVQTIAEAPALSCNIRVGNPTGIRSVTLLVNGEGRDGTKFIPFAETEQSSAWLFLIDRSNPRRAGTVNRNVEFVKNIVSKQTDRQQFGIATFASELKVIVDIGDNNADLDRRLADVKADGAATEFFATAIEGIKLLEQSDVNRRALVIMSDGKAEDTAYSRADLVAAAKAANVVIYGMGFAEKASETPDLQILRRLAEDTDGPFVSIVGDSEVPLEFQESFATYLENGGTVETDLSDIFGEAEIDLTVLLRDGSSFSRTQSLFVQAAEEIVEEVVPPLSWIAEIYSAADPAIDGASAWAESNQALATALLIALPLLILVALVALFARRRDTEVHDLEESPDAENSEPVTTPIAADDAMEPIQDEAPLLGWFELVDDQSDKFDIREMSVQIGRHSECDFRLNNDSVHRHHAHFHFNPEMEPTITDLDTVNGVLVNGERTNSSKLNSGDLIQLGEVRFRYYSN